MHHTPQQSFDIRELIDDHPAAFVLVVFLVCGTLLAGFLGYHWIAHRNGHANEPAAVANASGPPPDEATARLASTATGTSPLRTVNRFALPEPLRQAAAAGQPVDVEHTAESTTTTTTTKVDTERWRSKGQPVTTPPETTPPPVAAGPNPATRSAAPVAPPAKPYRASSEVFAAPPPGEVPPPPADVAPPATARRAAPPAAMPIMPVPDRAPSNRKDPPPRDDNDAGDPKERAAPPASLTMSSISKSKSSSRSIRTWSPLLERAWERERIAQERRDVWRAAHERRLAIYREITERLRAERLRIDALFSVRVDASGIAWTTLLRERYPLEIQEIETATRHGDTGATRQLCGTLGERLRADLSARQLSGVPVSEYLESRNFLLWLRSRRAETVDRP